jgi:hypothetical protein
MMFDESVESISKRLTSNEKGWFPSLKKMPREPADNTSLLEQLAALKDNCAKEREIENGKQKKSVIDMDAVITKLSKEKDILESENRALVNNVEMQRIVVLGKIAMEEQKTSETSLLLKKLDNEKEEFLSRNRALIGTIDNLKSSKSEYQTCPSCPSSSPSSIVESGWWYGAFWILFIIFLVTAVYTSSLVATVAKSDQTVDTNILVTADAVPTYLNDSSEITKIQETLGSRIAELEQCSVDDKVLLEDHIKSKNVSNTRITELRGQIKKDKIQLDELNQSTVVSNERIVKLEIQIKDGVEKSNELEKTRLTIMSRVGILEKQIKEDKAQAEKSTKAIISANKQVAALEIENKKEMKQSILSAKEKSALDTRIVYLENQVNLNSTQVEQLTKDNAQLGMEMVIAKGKSNEIEKGKDELTDRVAVLMDQLRETVVQSDLIVKSKAAVDSLLTDLESHMKEELAASAILRNVHVLSLAANATANDSILVLKNEVQENKIQLALGMSYLYNVYKYICIYELISIPTYMNICTYIVIIHMFIYMNIYIYIYIYIIPRQSYIGCSLY